MLKLAKWSALLFLVVLSTTAVFAQATTGTLSGTVTTAGNQMPGVTVTVSSPALQGTRTVTTGEAGGYYFPALPPGRYTVTFELAGMQRVEKQVTVNIAQSSRADADLKVSGVAEAITVTAAAPPAVETTEVAANFDVETINELPVGRTIVDTVLLAPGVNDAGPLDQISISGAPSFDNLFLVNGVVVQEVLRGQPHDLFIEDAVNETTILSGGISAEFGRFSGGVVSTVTKSGGNEFTGSLRDSLANPSWTDKSDYAAQVDPIDELNETYEATLGGRVIRDRLWFFTAGRTEDRETSRQTTQTNIPFVEGRTDRRWEAKLTGQIAQNHTLVGSYLDSNRELDNFVTSGRVVDLRGLGIRNEPKTLMSVHYSGIFSDQLLLEAQASRMDHDVVRGGDARDLINGTLLLDASTGNRMWSPTFCGTPCPVKQFDNKNLMAKASYFLSTAGMGNHSIVGGWEDFHQFRNDSNFQSGSDFRIHGNILQFGQDVFFGVDPDSSEIEWDPVPALSLGSDFGVWSVFLNDKWDLNEHWNFNVGVRYDRASGEDQAGNKTTDDSAFSPRLAASFDPGGDGRHKFGATYGRYVSKIDQGPADQTATVGRYHSYYWDYEGPVINPIGTPRDQLVPVEDVIQQVFAWFESVGGTENSEFLTSAHIPGVTLRFDEPLQAPFMDEWTVGYALSFPARGFIRADYINRSWGDFYVIQRDLTTGRAIDPDGDEFDQGVIMNSDADYLKREYNAIQLQGSYRPWNRLSIGGNYTFSELEGNVEAEGTNATAVDNDPFINRPEYFDFEQNNPVGFLGADMRHRANLWVQYDLPTPIGAFNFSLLERYHSALSYSAVGFIDVRAGTTTGPANGVTNPGYVTVPSNVGYFFTERGALRVDDITSTDLAINYSLPIGPVRLFVETEILNALGEQGIEDPDFIEKNIRTRRQTQCLQTGTSDRCAAFNPLQGETPQHGVHWQFAPNFGNPTSADAYQLPRTYRASVGIRF